MSGRQPLVTVIIPTRPGAGEVAALRAARQLEYPNLEILVARGRQPAVQRNSALRAARGELIYFLDDDSLSQPDNVRQALQHFADPQVQLLGGPNLCPDDAPWLEKVFGVVLSSWLAFGPSRARYERVGKARLSSEKELILCNMMGRRETLLALGGFDEALYPNEENALMDELQKRGWKLIYDPDFIVYRRPRPTLKAFGRMLMTYGRGRAEQFRLHPTPGSALNFVPPLFCLYLVAALAGAYWLGPLVWVPLVIYFLAVLGQTAVSCFRKGLLASLAAAPLLGVSHGLYGLGFWRGLFTTIKSPDARPPLTVELEWDGAPKAG